MGLFKRPRTGQTNTTPLPSKGKRRLLGSFFALSLLAVLAPVLIARTPLRNWIAASALARIKGDIRVGGASLWWFTPPVFTDIEVRDAAGRTLLRVPRVEGDKSFIALLCDPSNLGEFRFTQPALHVVCSCGSTNLEDALAYWLQREDDQPDAGPALEGIAVRAAFTQASAIVEDEDTGRKWTFDPLEISLSVPRDRRTPIQLKVHAAVADAHQTGRMDAEVSAHLVETNGGKPHIQAEGELHAEEVPLAVAEPFLRRFEPQIKLAGRLSANLKLHQADNQAGSPDVSADGDVSIQNLALSDPWLGPDVLRLARVDVPCRVALNGSQLRVERLEVQSDIGKVSLAGTVDLAKDLLDALNQPGHRVAAEVDLARLAGLLPNTLHLSKDTRITSGKLSVTCGSSARPDSVLWEGDLHTSDLQGEYQGQRIVWKDPLAIAVAARQTAGALPVFERFRCDSDFLRVEMSGSIDEWTASAGFNLGKLGEHLADFVDLGSIRLQGEGSARVTAKRNPRGGYRIESEAQVSKLNVTGPQGRAWREDNLTVRMDLNGEESDGKYRMNTGGVRMRAGSDSIDVDLLEPIADVLALRAASARVGLHGDLARWRGRLGNVAAGLDSLPIDGQTEMNGRVDLRLDGGPQAVQVDLTIQNMTLGSPAAPVWREPRVHVTGQCVYDAAKDVLQIAQLHLDSPTLSGDATGQVLALNSDMDLSLEGKLRYDLEKLGPQLRPYLGQGVTLTGRDTRPFRIAGALAAPATKPVTVAVRPAAAPPALLGRLRGEAGLNWQSVQAMGCQIGPGDLKGSLTSGWFRAKPIEATLNQGRLRLEPSLRVDPAPREVFLAKGRIIDRARLTPAVCASALGYALPVLADVVQAEGELSLDLDSGRVPLTDPTRAEMAGRLIIHSAQVGPGPLARELSVLLKGPATLTLTRENIVAFQVVNGRVYHSGLELHFPELTVRTSGSVGLDGSLSLVAEMPVPPKWLGSSKLASAIAKQTIRLPIGGTLSKPKIDERALREASAQFARDAAENAIRKELDGKLRKEAENELKKLFRPRK